MPNTVKLHRVLATSAEKVYRAFLEPDALASWLPPFGFVCSVHELQAKEGGNYRMSFRNFTTGKVHSFGGTYLKLVPGETLVYSDVFEDPVTLKALSVGTEMHIVQEGVPDMIPLELCYLGWQQSLRKLAELVEPNVSE